MIFLPKNTCWVILVTFKVIWSEHVKVLKLTKILYAISQRIMCKILKTFQNMFWVVQRFLMKVQ